MPKIHSTSRITDNKGNARIATYCAYHFPPISWRKILEDDIGIDGEFELYDEVGQRLAEILKIQLKSTEKDKGYIKGESKTHDNFTFYADKSDVDYWQRLIIDVLLIVFDGRDGKSDLYAKRIEGFDLKTITTESVPIVFNKKTDLINEKNNDFLIRFSRTLKEQAALLNIFLPKYFIPDLRYFVGREDLLQQVHSTLNTQHRVSIHDISGVGKTFCSLKYADLYKDSYDKLFFINSSKEAYLESLAECGVLLDSSVSMVQEQLVKANAFKNWLEQNNNWLVIFDNVDVAADIKPFVPNNLKGDCLFTSNFADVANLGETVQITKLNDLNSKKLLFSRATSIPQQNPVFTDQKEELAFKSILTEIDGLPISLTTTGAFIAGKKLSFVEYLERLEVSPKIIIEAEDAFDNYPKKSALKAFSIAFVENTDTTNADAQQKLYAEAVKMLYFAASFLAPDDIHEEFLRKFLETYFEPFQTSEKKTSFWQDVRAKFTEYDLFKFNQTDKTFRTHRLIQKTIQTKLNNDEKKTICEQVSEILGDLLLSFCYSNDYQDELSYVCNLESYSRHMKSVRIQSYNIFESLSNFYAKQGNLKEQIQVLKKRVEDAAKYTDIMEQLRATLLASLANRYYFQGEYQIALPLYEEALKIFEAKLPETHPRIQKVRESLMNCKQKLGES
jgi:tetratricopeptide (TPR) repeat protein